MRERCRAAGRKVRQSTGGNACTFGSSRVSQAAAAMNFTVQRIARGRPLYQNSNRAPICNWRAPNSAPDVVDTLLYDAVGSKQPFVCPVHRPVPGFT